MTVGRLPQHGDMRYVSGSYRLVRVTASVLPATGWTKLNDASGFSPRDAMPMRKRCLSSRPVSVRPYVCLSVRHVHVLYPNG